MWSPSNPDFLGGFELSPRNRDFSPFHRQHRFWIGDAADDCRCSLRTRTQRRTPGFEQRRRRRHGQRHEARAVRADIEFFGREGEAQRVKDWMEYTDLIGPGL